MAYIGSTYGAGGLECAFYSTMVQCDECPEQWDAEWNDAGQVWLDGEEFDSTPYHLNQHGGECQGSLYLWN